MEQRIGKKRETAKKKEKKETDCASQTRRCSETKEVKAEVTVDKSNTEERRVGVSPRCWEMPLAEIKDLLEKKKAYWQARHTL